MGERRQRVVLIEGDGIGPEISRAVQQIIEHSGAAIEWEPALAGERAMRELDTPLPAIPAVSLMFLGVNATAFHARTGREGPGRA